MSAASANVLQLVRSHYAGNDSQFASAALALARSSKVPSVKASIINTVQAGVRGSGPDRSGNEPARLEPLQHNPSSLLQRLAKVTFADLLLEGPVQAMLDEIVIELEYRDELAERKLRARNRLLFYGPPGNGKCLEIGTKVMLFSGALVCVEDVQVGDVLMGPDSKPRRVLGTTRGRGPLYRVTPTKGEPWVCNEEHVLTLVRSETGRIRDISVRDYLASSKDYKHHAKQFFPEGGVDFPVQQQALPVDPYFLGVWYGDGTKARDVRDRLAVVAVTKPDLEIRELMYATAAGYGAKVREHVNSTGCPTFAVTMGNNGNTKPNVLLHKMRVLYGDGLTLPHEYLTASRRDRELFFAGLMDTDGTDNCGGFEIVQKVMGYAEGICFLAHSLGLRATLREKRVNGDPYWRVIISGDCSGLPLRIARKRAAPRRQVKRVNRTGFTIEPIGVGDYAGFELDGDGRFLLGDFTVTHNSSGSAALADALGVPAYGVSLPRLIGSHIGETGQNLGKLFDEIRPDTVVVFDEIDALGARRNDGGSGADNERNSSINTLLTLLDRCKWGVIVGTTNRPDMLDPALLRRFDERIEFPAPTIEQLALLGAKLCEGYRVDGIRVTDCRNFDEVQKRCETEARRIVMAEILAAEEAGDNEDKGESDGEEEDAAE